MARKRMVSLDIIDTDLFMDMPSSTQCLYFHLLVRADDDGFVDSPRKIIKMVNCSDDDMKILLAKGFIIPFESGVCVISHWKIHNTIQIDRYKETLYLKEKQELETDDSKLYTKCIQNVSKMETQIRLDKIRLEENRIDKYSVVVPPLLEDVKLYCEERNNGVDYNRWFNFYESKGWLIGKNKMKDWKASVRTWEQKSNDPNWLNKEIKAEQLNDEEELELKKELESIGGK